jgi:hypothetical protein
MPEDWDFRASEGRGFAKTIYRNTLHFQRPDCAGFSALWTYGRSERCSVAPPVERGCSGLNGVFSSNDLKSLVGGLGAANAQAVALQF